MTMPLSGTNGSFRPLVLPPAATATMPAPVAEAWGEYGAAVEAHAKAAAAQAKAVAGWTKARQVHRFAPARISKADDARQQASGATRAAADEASRAERAFLAAAAAHAGEWQEALDAHSEVLAAAVQDGIDSVEGAMAELVDSVAYSGWATPNGDRLPERLPATGTPACS